MTPFFLYSIIFPAIDSLAPFSPSCLLFATGTSVFIRASTDVRHHTSVKHPPLVAFTARRRATGNKKPENTAPAGLRAAMDPYGRKTSEPSHIHNLWLQNHSAYSNAGEQKIKRGNIYRGAGGGVCGCTDVVGETVGVVS